MSPHKLQYEPQLIFGVPPDWADGWGEDPRHGYFVDYALSDTGLTDADRSALKQTQSGCGMSAGCDLRFRWDHESGNWVANGLTEHLIAQIRAELSFAESADKEGTISVPDRNLPRR